MKAIGYQATPVRSQTVSAKNMGNHDSSSVAGNSGAPCINLAADIHAGGAALRVDGPGQILNRPLEGHVFKQRILQGCIGAYPAADNAAEKHGKHGYREHVKHGPEKHVGPGALNKAE